MPRGSHFVTDEGSNAAIGWMFTVVLPTMSVCHALGESEGQGRGGVRVNGGMQAAKSKSFPASLIYKQLSNAWN